MGFVLFSLYSHNYSGHNFIMNFLDPPTILIRKTFYQNDKWRMKNEDIIYQTKNRNGLLRHTLRQRSKVKVTQKTTTCLLRHTLRHILLHILRHILRHTLRHNLRHT